MPIVELLMPKLGESIVEATILSWNKKVGDSVEIDEAVLEIATDKVDSEVPSEVAGVITEIKFEEGAVVPVGEAVALIDTGGGGEAPKQEEKQAVAQSKPVEVITEQVETAKTSVASPIQASEGSRFYSPLVMSMAKEENISMTELESIQGTGKDGRVTKNDMSNFIKHRSTSPVSSVSSSTNTNAAVEKVAPKPTNQEKPKLASSVSGNVEIVEMDRMRKMIAKHMTDSKKTSAHVTTFVEADVTNIVNWRNRVKADFQKQEGEKITFTPIFIEVVAKVLKEFPYVNSSIDGDSVILRKDINIGMATALPNGNLIVPVIKNCDQLNLRGITKKVNDLANRARNNKLKPDETTGGTYTLTNVGSFGNVMGTPIINQPQVGILAVGTIQKKPVVIETSEGDMIGIRHMMFLSHSYDHRIVDGAMGGKFVKRVAELLEQFDVNRTL